MQRTRPLSRDDLGANERRHSSMMLAHERARKLKEPTSASTVTPDMISLLAKVKKSQRGKRTTFSREEMKVAARYESSVRKSLLNVPIPITSHKH